MTRSFALIFATVVGAAGAGCESRPELAGTSAGADPLASNDVAAIHRADSAFAAAANAGDAAAVAAVYLADAHLMPPSAEPIKGREEIQKFWGGLLGAYQVKITLGTDEVEGRGDLAYARGHYTLEATPKAKGQPFREEGKFVEVLRRQPDGSWGYAVDMYSPNQPPPKAE
jgi:uncharacterized protein (TIGR02246 family)